MLLELRVRDLGVIDDLTLHPNPGMTVLTGETGAGKTLVVGALALVLGGRAGGAPVRYGAQEAVVEARFEGPGASDAVPVGLFDGPDHDETDGAGSEPAVRAEHVLARAVPSHGRSRAWENGRMATAAQLTHRAQALVDIHGQHDQHSLVSAAGRRRVLDAFGGIDTAPIHQRTRELNDIDRELTALGGDAAARARETDMLRYQLDEIAAVAVQGPEEDVELSAHEERLADVAAHREAIARAAEALVGTDEAAAPAPGARPGIEAALAALQDRRAFTEVIGCLRDASALLDDATSALRAIGEALEDDPLRLEAVQERRRQLGQLRRKYGATLADVIAFAQGATKRLGELVDADHVAAALEERRGEAQVALAKAQAEVRGARMAAAGALSDAATRRIRELAMPKASLAVTVGTHPAGDDVEILFAADGNTQPEPLARVASGGELARAALALRLVAVTGPDTMVFDEVDSGVGGEAAVALAEALRQVADTRQVLVVTHLAQVAARADLHVTLRKSDDAGRTTTVAEVLDRDGRIVELARMLSGHPDSHAARAHAGELLSRSDEQNTHRLGAGS